MDGIIWRIIHTRMTSPRSTRTGSPSSFLRKDGVGSGGVAHFGAKIANQPGSRNGRGLHYTNGCAVPLPGRAAASGWFAAAGTAPQGGKGGNLPGCEQRDAQGGRFRFRAARRHPARVRHPSGVRVRRRGTRTMTSGASDIHLTPNGRFLACTPSSSFVRRIYYDTASGGPMNTGRSEPSS
jgi:hypothetical protein